MPKYGIAAKHNESHDTWDEASRVNDEYIIGTKDNNVYEAWTELIRVENDGTLIGTSENPDYDAYDEIGINEGTELLAGSELAQRFNDIREEDTLGYIDGDYVKAGSDLDHGYRKGDRIIKVEAAAPPGEYLALALGVLISGVLHSTQD